ncbi:major facilitator superfamily domain-containing protein 10 [Holotrichia oblita]|uniref:Major facilitator superfamily domain-containing protein 10 n=1 Tax=Holotrichia oblita TaxID=644536 RepID=A0ACB9T025_HOLOL|nr:major facilitator superfamily domain-containing protein 10 [Holotrichia oblita]
MELKHKLYFIYTISFLDLFAIGLMFPLLYPHIRELGGSHFVIGLLGSTYSALQVLTGFIKHTQTICKALIADSLPIEQQAAAYGQSSGYGMLGFVIGPILGGHISEMNDGFFYVCCFTSFLFVINIVLALSLPDNTKTSDKVANINILSLLSTIHKEFLRAVRELLKINWKIYWDTFLMRFLFAISVSIIHSSHSLYLKEKYNLSQVNIGYTISFLSIVGVICGLSMGKITKVFYKNDHDCLRRIYHSFCTMAACSVGFYLAPGLYTFYAILVPFSISSTLLRIVTMELMITKSKNDEKGSLSGASNSIMSIARFITPLSSGIIGDIFGENVVMLSGLVPALTGSLVCIYLMRRGKVKGD